LRRRARDGRLIGPQFEEREAMAIAAQNITPCLWFDTEAEDAAKFYCSVFKNSRITDISRYGNEGQDITGKEPGTVMVAAFELNGQPFVAPTGGPQFKFSEAISFQIHCKTPDEIDYYWSKLTECGQEGPCGWLKDRFGLSRGRSCRPRSPSLRRPNGSPKPSCK
jgi:predicted 3-demethylubiquinone-9 3-methyltransferase (glyoxalase superfamily)